MSTLAEIRDRVEQALLDTGNAIFTADLIDEAIRQALDEYNAVSPLAAETVVTLPGDGREIALEDVTGLVEVTDVWWPYDSDATTETWPPNRVAGYRVYWDDARPVLFLDLIAGDQPQQDDEVRVWYTKRHTIQDLDSAAVTTLTAEHEILIVIGAAGGAALSRALDLIETAGTDLYAVGLLATWGKTQLREFRTKLAQLQRRSARRGRAYGDGWKLDKWDSMHDGDPTGARW
jgi:hypothetical protein